MATFCPTCKGLMRPRKGVLECLRCSAAGRQRTVVSGGRAIRLGEGQAALGARATHADPPLAPRPPGWTPQATGAPDPVLGLFPHDTIREGQRRLARDVTLTVQRGGHLVAHAPTGLGKTAASLAPALAHALDHGKTVLFLTSRQSQHRIAVETLRQIRQRRGARFTLVDLVSKRDMCLRDEAQDLHPARFPDFCSHETRTRSCSFLGEVDAATLKAVADGVLHVEELMHVAKRAHLCPHLVAMTAATGAHVVVADYNHLFSDIRERSLERLGRSLADLIVVVDEAHNLPERIRQAHAHRVTEGLLGRVEEEARRHAARDVVADVAALRAAWSDMALACEAAGTAEDARPGDARTRIGRLEIKQLPDAFERRRNRGMLAGTHRTLANAIESLGPLAAKAKQGTDAPVAAEALRDALDDWGRFRTGALRYVEWDRADPGVAPASVALHVRLLDPAVAARQVFDGVASSVLMSGTLEPPEAVRDLLGLAEARTTVRRYDSPFDPARRPVFVARGVTTRYTQRGAAMWERIAGHVAGVAGAVPGNVAVFAPSYEILGSVRRALPDVGKALLVEEPEMGKAERDGMVDALRARGGAVLLGVLGGSFAEGVDYPGRLLDAVCVVGLPLAPPDLEVEAGVAYLETRFAGRGRLYGYVAPAVTKVLQAMGRGIRSSTDRCAVVLLDDRFLTPPYRGLLPPLVPVEEPADAVRAFIAQTE